MDDALHKCGITKNILEAIPKYVTPNVVGLQSPTKNYLIELNSLEETTIFFHQQSSYKHLQDNLQ
jgi:hypothetical protein